MNAWDEIRGVVLGADLTPEAASLILGAARAAGFLLCLPAWSSRLVPLRFRWAFALALVLLVMRSAPEAAAVSLRDPVQAPLLLLGEAVLGAALGWGGFVVLAAARAAGSLISDQIGLSLGGAMDPLAETGEPALRGFLALFAINAFLSLDLHHPSLRAAASSFELFPPGSLLSEDAFAGLGKTFLAQAWILFTAALAIAFPVTAALLLAGVAQAIASRAFPQMEFFLFGFPARAITGLVVMALSLPLLAGLFARLFSAAGVEAALDFLKG